MKGERGFPGPAGDKGDEVSLKDNCSDWIKQIMDFVNELVMYM